jgi:hypothetical protein
VVVGKVSVGLILLVVSLYSAVPAIHAKTGVCSI